MGWITTQMLNVALWGLVRYAEKQADDVMSDNRARLIRRQIEDKLYHLALRKQDALTSQTTIDDKALHFVQVVFKSRWLDEKINAFRGVE